MKNRILAVCCVVGCMVGVRANAQEVDQNAKAEAASTNTVSAAPQEKSPFMRSVAIALRFSHDGTKLISAGAILKVESYQKNYGYWYRSQDQRLRVWNAHSERETWRLPAKPITPTWGSNSGSNWKRNTPTVLLMPNFKNMLTTWGGHDVKNVKIHSFRLDKDIDVDCGNIGSLALSPDERILAIGMTRAVEFRDATTYKVLRNFYHSDQGTNVQFGPDNSTVMCTWNGSSKPQAVDVATGKQIRYPRWFYRVRNSDAYAFAPEGNTLAMARGRNIEIWTTPREDAGKKLRTFTTRLNKVNVLQFSPDGKTLAAGGESSTTTPVQFFKL